MVFTWPLALRPQPNNVFAGSPPMPVGLSNEIKRATTGQLGVSPGAFRAQLRSHIRILDFSSDIGERGNEVGDFAEINGSARHLKRNCEFHTVAVIGRPSHLRIVQPVPCRWAPRNRTMLGNASGVHEESCTFARLEMGPQSPTPA